MLSLYFYATATDHADYIRLMEGAVCRIGFEQFNDPNHARGFQSNIPIAILNLYICLGTKA